MKGHLQARKVLVSMSSSSSKPTSKHVKVDVVWLCMCGYFTCIILSRYYTKRYFVHLDFYFTFFVAECGFKRDWPTFLVSFPHKNESRLPLEDDETKERTRNEYKMFTPTR